MMKLNKWVNEQYRKNLVMTLRFSAVISLVMVAIYGLTCIVLVSVLKYELSIFEYGIVIVFSAMMLSIMQPFLYSYFISTYALNDEMTRDKVNMSVFFANVFSDNKNSKGKIGLFSNFLYGILVYLGLSIVVSFVVFGILYVINPDFSTFVKEAISLSESLDYAGLNNLLSENSSILAFPILLVESISTLGGFWFFLHRIGVNFFKYFLAGIGNNLPHAVFNGLFKTVIKENRKLFYFNYYRVSWIFLIVIVIVFPTSYFLLYYLNIYNSSFLILDLTSIVITVLFLLPLLPLLFNTYSVIAYPFELMLVTTINEKIDQEVELLKKNYDGFSVEEKKEVDALIIVQKQIKENFEKSQINNKNGQIKMSKKELDDFINRFKDDNHHDDNGDKT